MRPVVLLALLLLVVGAFGFFADLRERRRRYHEFLAGLKGRHRK